MAATTSELKKLNKMADYLRLLIGQKVAVLCARYNYRGILAEVVGDDGVVLQHPAAVEISGPSNADRPNQEDYIGGSIFISAGAIEIVYQPKWVEAPLGPDGV